MVRVLGFRVEPQRVHWAVAEGTQKEPLVYAHDKAAAPVNAAEAAALAWYRERTRHLLSTYDPSVVVIRASEPIARARGEGPRRRLRIEGVLMEATHSFGLNAETVALKSISSRLGSDSAKKYVAGSEFRGVKLSGLPTEAREAILAAISLLPSD